MTAPIQHPISVADVLDRAADLIEPEGAWTQGAYARGKSGRPVELRRSAVCFCTLGAISVVNGSDPCFEVVMAKQADALRKAAGLTTFQSIAAWNDAPERTQAEVVAALRSAATAARQQGEGK